MVLAESLRAQRRHLRQSSKHVSIVGKPIGNGGVVRIPTVLSSIGDHIRRRRLTLKLLQKEVVAQLAVNVACLVAMTHCRQRTVYATDWSVTTPSWDSTVTWQRSRSV